MTDRELYRLGIIQRVFDRALLQRDTADILELSVRQVQRLVRLYRTDGATAFASSRRGRPANNRINEEIRCKTLDLIRCHYSDFGPTLATEKLAERHHINLSVETVRNWMTADGLWRPHSRRRPRVYQPRYRRDCLGELVQIDGSHHDWFEARAPKCCLLVFMDDATGRLMHLRFCDSENAFDYMMATRQYIDKHGKPVAFYSDKHAVFKVNGQESRRAGTTQFGRALRELAIELICANSSQAKGRVERVNKTLQDRLIKEMRLQNICSIAQANQWIENFISDFNRRFSRPAKYPKDLHRPVIQCSQELDDI
ncbi:TPA: ISNCY family transposase, partial [Escherichia coli]